MRPALEAFHLEAADGFRFCVLRRPPPDVPVRGGIVHVPAFAEEMNKSRRMVALQAHSWAAAGWLVLQIDLRGCGDSSGDFGDASWDDWLDDVRSACAWFEANGIGDVWLWGLRLGALVAAEAATRFGLRAGLLLWQPVASGRQHLQQFLRMWKMAQVVGKLDASGDAPPMERLRAGQTVEVAGYAIAPALAEGMQAAELSATADVAAVHWFEVHAGAAPGPSPAYERLAAGWRAADVPIVHWAAQGPSFWQTQEIELAPGLLEASTRALAGAANPTANP